MVVLVQGTTPGSQVSNFVERFGPGVQRLAFSVDDLNSAIDRVRRAGGAAEIAIVEGQGIRQVFLRRDPGSAVRVELIERKGGNFRDHSVQTMFQG